MQYHADIIELEDFYVNHISSDEGVALNPVPFSSTSDKPILAFVALNPKYDPGQAALKKRKGGQTWAFHGDFYNDREIYRYVIEDKKSKYYQKQTKFIYALLNPDAYNIKIEAIRKETKLSDYGIFEELTTACPILFGEFIPFHSKGFSLKDNKVEGMMDKLPGYKGYFQGLLSAIVDMIPSHGLIVIDGKTPTDAFERLMGQELELVHKSCRETDKKLLYDIYKWQNRYILLARSVICGSGTDLSKLEVVKQLPLFVDDSIC